MNVKMLRFHCIEKGEASRCDSFNAGIWEVLEGPLSAVSKPAFATEGSFCRNVKDQHAFAPLKKQIAQFFALLSSSQISCEFSRIAYS